MLKTFSRLTHRTLLVAMLAGSTLLSGCGVLLVGGAATTASVAADRRTTGEQVEDQTIELKTGAEMTRLFGDKARVVAVSYARKVLLIGDVPNEQDKAKAADAAAKVENVKEVINRLRVGEITPLSVRTNDTWITTKVRTALINAKDVPARTIVVTTERGVVYLQGKVTETEGLMAARVASTTVGVNEVIKLFQIVARETLVTDPVQGSAPGTAAPVSTAQPEIAAPSSGAPDTQTMPVQ